MKHVTDHNYNDRDELSFGYDSTSVTDLSQVYSKDGWNRLY